MAKSLDPSTYPAAWLQLAADFEANPKPCTIYYANEREMLSGRLDLYGFIRAIRKVSPGDYPNFVHVRLSVSRRKPWRLTVQHTDTTFKGTVHSGQSR